MDGQGAIWVLTHDLATGQRIQEMLRSARLLNPIRVFDDAAEFDASFQVETGIAIILFDLGFPVACRRRVIETLAAHERKSNVVALVDEHCETLLDEAYEAGVLSYLHRDFTFADFLQRIHLLDLRLVIDRSDSPL